MSHVPHLQGNHFSIGAQGEGVPRKIQAPLQRCQRSVTQKRGDIRIQYEGRGHTLRAGHSYGDINGMANFSSPAIAKFESRMGLICGHRGKTATRQKSIMAA